MTLALSVIQYPSGRWGFVGRLPSDLAFITDSPEDLETARQCGPGIAGKIAARNNRRFEQRSWPTKADALAEAARLGHDLTAPRSAAGPAVR